MINREFTYNNFTFKRINKKEARKAYTHGLTVIIAPCNLKPFTPWHVEYNLNISARDEFLEKPAKKEWIENDFNNYINSFEYYNCINSETGRYTAFYIPVRYVNPFTGAECGRDYYHAIQEYDYSYLN